MNEQDQDTDIGRRNVLQAAAGLLAAGSLASGRADAGAAKPAATGKPGDFDFLNGRWTIDNRKRKDGGWDRFPGEATVFGILGGVVSVEELRIPARDFSGMGLRALDRERGLWADWWVNGKSGVLSPPPTWGSFVDGVGTWDAEDKEGDKPVIWRGVWDRIAPRSCRWFQAVSRDGGRTWEEQWVMEWTRAG